MGTFAFLASRDARPPPPAPANTRVRARAAAHVWRRGGRDAQNENLCGPFPPREWGERNESGVLPRADRVEGKRGRPGNRGGHGEGGCASGTRLCTSETLKQGHKDGRMATGSRHFYDHLVPPTSHACIPRPTLKRPLSPSPYLRSVRNLPANWIFGVF